MAVQNRDVYIPQKTNVQHRQLETWTVAEGMGGSLLAAKARQAGPMVLRICWHYHAGDKSTHS